MDKGLEKLLSARKSLISNVQKSEVLGLSLQKAEIRFSEIKQRLPSLEVSIRPIRADWDALGAVGGHIDRAVVPAAAVLKVFNAIHGLEKSLPNPRHDLAGYLGVLQRLQEALRFLGENCEMAVQWLSDIVEYLEDHAVADQWFISGLKDAVSSLRRLAAEEEKGRLDAGLLEAALVELENEFRRLLVENTVPLPMALSDGAACIAPAPLPVAIVHKLQAVLGRLMVSNRIEKCMADYVKIRSLNVRVSLRALGLDYLDISVTEFNDIAAIEGYIDQWGQHLEFAVKHLFEAEYKLCGELFESVGLDVWKSCFAKIAAEAGVHAFLQFGKTVAESKKDPIKLLKLLDIFASFSKLRVDFNRLFGGAPCTDIQNLTRDLIKRVVEGACEIFWELLVQVELQRHAPPPSDCSIPRVVTFITDYCNRLLSDNYKPILMQVLIIERSWKKEKFQEQILVNELLNLVNAVEINIETWSKGCADVVASHLFSMNNHWHLYKYVKGTKLGSLLGDSWLKEHEHYSEYCLSMYLQESWGKLPALLSREGLILFSGGRATAPDLVKQRLKSFNEAFEDIYRKHASWAILDKELCERTCRVIIQTIVPIYRSFMQNYGALIEQDQSTSKYAKYTAQTLEQKFNSLFYPKPVKQGSFKAIRYPSGKFNSDAVNQIQASPTVK